ncbi:MAG: T9SS type A sorting domain-containing protein [Ignavibacteriales bacterium]|nr:T9SS type A sorting domain-containing protein [Ignavibacteriales bacterium]
MKFRYHVLIVEIFLIIGWATGQVPNGGFETWNNGEPVGWITSNSAPTFINVTQNTESHNGSYAVHGEIVNVMGIYNVSPQLWSGNDDVPGIPVDRKYSAVRGFYKFTSVAGDSFVVIVAIASPGGPSGFGLFIGKEDVTTYTEFVVPIEYFSEEIPDTAVIHMTIDPIINGNLGSTFDVDDIEFVDANDVVEGPSFLPRQYRLEQNFPNPFNPSTVIIYSIANETNVRLSIYDILGREVSVLMNQRQAPGRYKVFWDASGFSSGIFFYRLQTENYSAMNKMVMMK